ncbi:MAG: response regulator transcription factor, partial [Porcipelethomonas sp.]
GLIAEGLSNKEIAAELFLSEGTVRNYLSEILEKLQLRDRTQLAVFYYRQNRP